MAGATLPLAWHCRSFCLALRRQLPPCRMTAGKNRASILHFFLEPISEGMQALRILPGTGNAILRIS
ncbi:hypothetical protein [Candidatus Nitrotoga fabula]|uniref:hypothetical protein n=1 Tax=Candidatus Nitrotoga fabula TaxID=2182327 RepID=UPI001BB47F36|nr:hypothetical protein [Candidatus Nitrotoga fabula]